MRTSTIVSVMFCLCILLLGLVGCMAASSLMETPPEPPLGRKKGDYLETVLKAEDVMALLDGESITIVNPNGLPRLVLRSPFEKMKKELDKHRPMKKKPLKGPF